MTFGDITLGALIQAFSRYTAIKVYDKTHIFTLKEIADSLDRNVSNIDVDDNITVFIKLAPPIRKEEA